MKKILPMLLFCMALLLAASGFAGTINLATGLDSSGNLIGSGGQNDANWTVQQIGGTGPAQTVFPGNADWFGGWAPNGPNSDWIARDANNCCNGPAPYSFSRIFNLSSGDVSNVSISGSWAIDDQGTLSLNGNTIATLGNGQWGSLSAFSPHFSPAFLNADREAGGWLFEGLGQGRVAEKRSAALPRDHSPLSRGRAP